MAHTEDWALKLPTSALQGGSASMQSSSRGNQGSGAGQQQQQQQQGSQRFQGANPQTAVQRTGGRPRAMMQRRPRGGRAGESLLTPFFASDVPGCAPAVAAPEPCAVRWSLASVAGADRACWKLLEESGESGLPAVVQPTCRKHSRRA